MQNAQALPISAIPSPNTPPDTTARPPASGQRFGRTALLIHMLAWLAFSSAWVLMTILGEYTPESQAAQGVGGATALCFAIWSGLLALRAIWHGERVLLPIFILLLVGTEATIPCLWLWGPLLTGYNPLSPLFEFTLWAGLPILVPFFVAGSCVAVPVAWLATRAVERLKRKPGDTPWPRRARLKTGLVAYLAVFLILLTTIFPYALYAYVALEQNHRKIWSAPFNWQGAVLTHMPDYVRTGLDKYCSQRLPWRFVRHRVALIENGQLPAERLIAHMHDPREEIRAAAWKTYFRDHTMEAIERCEQALREEVPDRRFEVTWDLWHARQSFRDWPAALRRRWVELLCRHLDERDFRLRRAAARILQSCLNKPAQLRIPWPWDEQPAPEQANEQADIDETRRVAEEWLEAQRKREEPDPSPRQY